MAVNRRRITEIDLLNKTIENIFMTYKVKFLRNLYPESINNKMDNSTKIIPRWVGSGVKEESPLPWKNVLSVLDVTNTLITEGKYICMTANNIYI